MNGRKSLIEWMIGAKWMRMAFLLAVIFIGAIVLFHDYNIEEHAINVCIHLLDKGNEITEGLVTSSSPEPLAGKRISLSTEPLDLSFRVVTAPYMHYIVAFTSFESDNTKTEGFSPVLTSPPRI